MSQHTPVDFQTRSFAFACEIVRFYRLISARANVPQALARQVLRSACSIGANLEEAQSAQSRRDLLSKFSIALKEARETQYWLRLLTATDLVPADDTARLLQEASELVAILTTSVKRLKL
ncbi:MAG: four helix bundle protein [Acidobacteriota bacterium]|nr:four helix bundle protein [Acidobacteriota bacterium]